MLSIIHALETSRRAVEFTAANVELQRFARTDPLTGLYNRRYLHEQLLRETQRTRRGARRFSVIVCDMDNFKAVNDTHGHPSGDEVLQGVARTLLDGVRTLAVTARWGGEELLILLPDSDAAQARLLACRIRGRLACSTHGARQLTVLMTYGIVECHPEVEVGELLRVADETLYRGKQAGGDRIEIGHLAPAAPGTAASV